MTSNKVWDLVNAEREKQVALGWTTEHDDAHSPDEWIQILEDLITQFDVRVTAMGWNPDATRAVLAFTTVGIAILESAERRGFLPGYP